MLLKDLITILGNPTTHPSNTTMLTLNVYAVTLDHQHNCLLLHTIDNVQNCRLTIQSQSSLAQNQVQLDLPISLGKLNEQVQAALQWDYVASQNLSTSKLA
jgi:hypothetical protein